MKKKTILFLLMAFSLTACQVQMKIISAEEATGKPIIQINETDLTQALISLGILVASVLTGIIIFKISLFITTQSRKLLKRWKK